MAPSKPKSVSNTAKNPAGIKPTKSLKRAPVPLAAAEGNPAKKRKSTTTTASKGTVVVTKALSTSKGTNKEKTRKKNSDARKSSTLTRNPAKHSAKLIGNPKTAKASTIKSSTSPSSTRKSTATGATKTKKGAESTFKAKKSAKPASDKSVPKRRSNGVASAVRMRSGDLATLQVVELEKQKEIRSQMKASRAARAAARGLPTESSEEDDEDEDEEDGEDEEGKKESNEGKPSPGKDRVHSGKDSAADLSDEGEDNSPTPRKPGSPSKTVLHDTTNRTTQLSSPIKKSPTLSPVSPTRIIENNSANLPNVTVKDHEGNEIKLADIAKEQGVVVFAYPKANTPGCTKQAASFRDNFATFKDLGYAIYGISYDNPIPQKSWKNKQGLPYTLLSSARGTENAIKALGASKLGDKIERSHWVFAKGGSLLDRVIGVKADNSMTKALEVSRAHPQI